MRIPLRAIELGKGWPVPIGSPPATATATAQR